MVNDDTDTNDVRVLNATDLLWQRFSLLDVASQDSLLADCLEALDEAAPELSETLLRIHYFGEKQAHVAEHMGVTEGAVSKRKSAAILRLRQILGERLSQQRAQKREKLPDSRRPLPAGELRAERRVVER